MNALRFAMAIAFSRDRRQRWRQVSIAVAGAIGTLVCLISIALPLAATDAYERGTDRAPIWDPALVADPGDPVPEDASLAIVQLASVVDGAQIPTIWIEPLPGHEDDPDIIPVGLDAVPAPGTAVLSPGLQSAGYTAEDFGWESSNAGSGPGGSIGDDGLMTASERLIYVRPAEGRTLGSGPSALFTQGFENYRSAGAAFVTDPEIPPPSTLRQGAAIFLLIPGLVLLISAARARSGLREQRLALMVTFGVQATVARALLALETALLATVGAVIGVLTYPLVAMIGRHVPGTRIHLADGALGAPWWAFPGAIVMVAGVAAICGAVGRLEPKGARRPVRRVRYYGFAAFVVSLICLVLSSLPGNPLALVVPTRDAQSILLAVGTFGAILTVPFAVPVVTVGVARLAVRSRRVAWWVAGRRLQFEAVRLSRVASALSILIVVLSTATALWGASAVSQAEEARGGSPLMVRDVSWRDAQAGDAEEAEQRLDDAGIDALFLPTRAPSDEFASSRLVIDDCRAFVTYFGREGSELCGAQNAEALADYVETMTGMSIADESTAVGRDVADDAVVVTRGPVPLQQVQKALGFLPGANIAARYSDVPAPRPLPQWIMAGALSALVLLGTAVLREIGDKSIEDAERDSQYMRLGLSARTADALAWTVLLIPLSAGVSLAFLASMLIAYQGEAALVMQGDPVRLSIVAVTALVVAGAAILVAGPARRALRTA